MKRKVGAGLTGVTLPIFVTDSTGAGLAVAFNAAGLVGEYRRQGQSTWTAITLASGTLGTWSSGGWAADGALTGAYEVGIPDAAFATGARFVVIRFRGATNMQPVLIEVELDAVNYQDATRFGLSALPNAAAASANGLLTFGTSAGQLNPSSGKLPATLAAADVSGNLPADLQTIKTQSVTCGAAVTVLASVGTAATSTAQTGDAFARLGAAGAGLTAIGDSRLANLDALVSSRAATSDARLANLDATVSSRSTYNGADTSGTTTLLGRLTTTRAGLLDNLDAAISTRSTYNGADSAGVTTLLSRLTAPRAAALDLLSTVATDTASLVDYVVDAQTTGTVATSDATTTTVTVSGLTQAKSYVDMQLQFTGASANANTRRTITAQSNVGPNIRFTLATAFGSVPASGDTLTVF